MSRNFRSDEINIRYKENRRNIPSDKKIDREKVMQVFAKLRQGHYGHRILARANFECCGSCASALIQDRMDETDKYGMPKYIGYAFWHQQAEAGAFGARNTWGIRRHNLDLPLYINFSHGASSDPALSQIVGNIIVKALREAGLNVKWNGESNNAIAVLSDWGASLNGHSVNKATQEEAYGIPKYYGSYRCDSPVILEELRVRRES